MVFSIRSGLLAVAILGVVTCGLAMFALARPLMSATSGRSERARDAAEGEVRRLQGVGLDPNEGPSRSGVASPDETFDSLGLPWPAAPGALRELLAESRKSHAVATSHIDITDAEIFLAIGPTNDGTRYAWAAYLLPSSGGTPVVRVVGISLDLLVLALTIAAIFAVLAVSRGADALTSCLAVLGRDLSTPVPRSRIKELNSVADGIAGLANELARAQDELSERERLAVLGRVTAGVAHELRNPLATMKLRIDLLKRNHKVPPAITPELEIVVEEIVRLDRLVHDLLTIAGRRLSEQKQLDVGDLVRRRVEVMKQLAAETHVSIEVTGSASMRVDPDALARVIDNLLKNAIEASPPDAVVTVAIDDDGGARVRFSDRGPGVAPERADELFEPFFTTKPDGVGLGLALSRAIAVAHGGTLTYMRERDATVFELRIGGAA